MRPTLGRLILVLCLGACETPVSLVVDPDDQESPDAGEPSGRRRGPPALDEPAWMVTDFGRATDADVAMVAWAPDGALAAGINLSSGGGAFTRRARLDLFDARGARLWSDELGYEDLATPEAGDPSHPLVTERTVTLSALAVDERGIHAAYAVVLGFYGPTEDLRSSHVVVRSYALDGTLTRTVSLPGVNQFPREAGDDAVLEINSIRGMPDGSMLWSGLVGRGAHPRIPDHLVSQGGVGMLGPDGRPSWTIVLGGELDLPDVTWPPEETALDAQPTADGGVLIRGHLHGDLQLGDLHARAEGYRTSSFVARLGLDGAPAWLVTVPSSEPMRLPALGTDATGHAYTVVRRSGDLRDVLVRVDPAGAITSEMDVDADDRFTMTIAGNRALLAGSVWSDGRPTLAYAQILGLGGRPLSDRLFEDDPVVGANQAILSGAISPDGYTALGGSFSGSIQVDHFRGASPERQQGFIAVFEPGASVD